MNNILFTIILLSLTACSASYPIKGSVDKTHERFLGTASASLFEENGAIDIQMENGAICHGTYPRVISSGGISGSGTFNCDDGKQGKFSFSGTNRQGGQGYGKLSNGNKFSFVYGGNGGSAADDAAMISALGAVGQSMQPVQQPIIIPSAQPYLVTPPSPSVVAPMYTPPSMMSCGSQMRDGVVYTNCRQ